MTTSPITTFCKKIARFFATSLAVSRLFPNFAKFKSTGGKEAAGQKPAVFVPAHIINNNTTVTASRGGNTLGVLLVELEQRVVRSFFNVLNNTSMQVNELLIGWAMTQPNRLEALRKVLENLRTFSSRRRAQANKWLDSESETFTRLCATEEGESFTRRQVVKAHAYAAGMFIMILVASWLEGGAA